LAAPLKLNVVGNPEFDSGTTGWSLGLQGGAAATLAAATNGGLSGTSSARINITNRGTANYHVQLNQTVSLVSGKTYQISFMAKADAAKTVDLVLQQNASPFTVYFGQYNINVTTTAATYGPFTFNSTVTNAAAQLHFNLASNTTGLWIDKVIIDDGTAPTNTPTRTATATVTNTPTRTPTPTPTNTSAPASALRIEIGNTASFTDGAGNVWQPDSGYAAGSGAIVDRGNIAIANTIDDKIYQTERWGATGCNYTRPNGTYTVRLHFAETSPAVTGVGGRIFNVNVEGQALNNLDVFAQAGGKNTALIKSFTVNLTDGQITITLTANVQATLLNGVEIIPGIAQTPTPNPTATPTATATTTGGFWPSGVFVSSWTPADFEAFATWRGRALGVATIWPERQTWADFNTAVPVYTNFNGKPYTMVYGIPLIPENAGATLAQVAAGTYNQQWRDLGTTLVNTGHGNAIIRLGWEFNGNWYAWAAYDPTTWINAFRQAETSIKSSAPNVRIDWTVNRGTSQSIPSGNSADAYPGDAYVDIIGVDSYDHWGDWNSQLNGNQGLAYWASFARTHGKKFSVPEWGLVGAAPGNGDNAAYITNMFNFFTANKDILAYEAYFNCSCAGVTASLNNPNDNPNGSAEYNVHW
jgi:Malectin domain/Carbohydrate binding domain